MLRHVDKEADASVAMLQELTLESKDRTDGEANVRKSGWNACLHPSFVTEYHYGSKGRSCERAAWEQAVTVEFTAGQGMPSAAALVDPTRAYEHVVHFLLVMAAVRHDFPL
eukprot:8526684-Pyramimonas_sp.AAC.1